METAIILSVVVVALVLCIGAVITFVCLSGWASASAMRGLLSLGNAPVAGKSDPAHNFMTAEQSAAIVAESQSLLRESLQREAFNSKQA